jgi:lipopolysaccharide export system protein LptA
VHVIRPTGTLQQRDELTCDLLTVTSSPAPEDDLPLVEPNTTAAGETTSAADNRGLLMAIPRNLKPDRIRAASYGEPSVVFLSDEHGLRADMNEFEYEVGTKTIHITHPKYAEIIHEETKFFSPDITLVRNEQDELESLICLGPGEMQYIPKESNRLELQAQWKNKLRISPEKSTGLTLIELDREAVISQPVEDSLLKGDYIQFWVSQVAASASTPQPDSRKTGEQPLGWNGKNLIPHKMLVLKNVQFSNPDLVGEKVERLNVTFVDGPTSVKQPKRSSMSLLPSNRSKRNNTPNRTLSTLSPMKTPAELSARDIEIVVRRGTELNESWVESITTSGEVILTQQKNPLEPPLVMHGDRVEVINSDKSNDNQVIHVFGKPARIEDREMRIVGNQLHLDRENNRAWVTGPGMMQSLVVSDLEGKKLIKPQILSVLWHEKMNFDGKTAAFYDQVRTTLDESELLCQEMEVVLSKKIDFGEQRKPLPADKPEIERLHCRYGVKVESQKTESGKITEVRSGHFGELLFEQETGSTLAQGPGELRIWRVGTPNRAGLARGNETLTNTSMHTRETGWNFSQIEFTGIVEGNLESKITTFRDRVQIIYGPVSKPGELLDPDDLPEQGAWMTSESLQLTLHPKTKTEDGWLTMRAEGNVDLEGYNFFAQADLVTYDESQKTYRMKAFGKRKAKISLQEYAGREPLDTEAQFIEYKPEQSYLKADGVTMFIGVSNARKSSPK